MKRRIFPALLNTSERRSLAKLSAKTRCSQSAVIRHLITHEAPLAKMCHDLIGQLLRDKTFRHRALLIREIRHFVKIHGGVPELERLLRRERL